MKKNFPNSIYSYAISKKEPTNRNVYTQNLQTHTNRFTYKNTYSETQRQKERERERELGLTRRSRVSKSFFGTFGGICSIRSCLFDFLSLEKKKKKQFLSLKIYFIYFVYRSCSVCVLLSDRCTAAEVFVWRNLVVSGRVGWVRHRVVARDVL